MLEAPPQQKRQRYNQSVLGWLRKVVIPTLRGSCDR
jgi:hypothetical protein